MTQVKQTIKGKIDKGIALFIAILCCPAIGGLLTYLFTMNVSNFEGAKGFAFFYLILPMIVMAFFIIYLLRFKQFLMVIIAISLSVYLFVGLMALKERYENKHCRITYKDKQNGKVQTPLCQKLQSLPNW